MRLFDRLRELVGGKSHQAGYAPINAAVGNAGPDPSVGVIGGRPGTWGAGVQSVMPEERRVTSLKLGNALNVLGNEMASARIAGVESSGGQPLYPGIPWRTILRHMARMYYLEGGWILWHQKGLDLNAPTPQEARTSVITLFRPQDLDPVDPDKNGVPVAYKYYPGGGKSGDTAITIPLNELGIHITSRIPMRADVRLRQALMLEKEVIVSSVASAKAARPRLVIRFNYAERTPARDNQRRKELDPNYVEPTDGVPLKSSVDEAIETFEKGGTIRLFDGEEAWVLQYSMDPYFTEALNDVAAMVGSDSGIPAPLLGSSRNLTYANLAQFTLLLLENTIMPLGASFAEVIRGVGFPDFDLDFSDHYAVQVTRADQALTNDRQATTFERLRRGGLNLPDSARMSVRGMDENVRSSLAEREDDSGEEEEGDEGDTASV